MGHDLRAAHGIGCDGQTIRARLGSVRVTGTENRSIQTESWAVPGSIRSTVYA